MNIQQTLDRLRFALRVQEEIAALQADPVVWKNYLAEAETSSVADGIL